MSICLSRKENAKYEFFGVYEGDISKPRTSNVIRDKQGQVKYVIVSKGLLFKKMVIVPANRIKEVRRGPEDKKGPGEIVIETTPEDERELQKRGLDILSDIEKGDLVAEVQEAMPTAEGLEALETENKHETESKQEESKQLQPLEEAGEEWYFTAASPAPASAASPAPTYPTQPPPRLKAKV